MSYSFSVQADTKADAKDKIAKEWDNIVAQQPIHAADKDAALSTAEDFVEALSDPDGGELISVSAYGSVSYYPDKNNRIVAVSGTVSASLASKP